MIPQLAVKFLATVLKQLLKMSFNLKVKYQRINETALQTKFFYFFNHFKLIAL